MAHADIMDSFPANLVHVFNLYIPYSIYSKMEKNRLTHQTCTSLIHFRRTTSFLCLRQKSGHLHHPQTSMLLRQKLSVPESKLSDTTKNSNRLSRLSIPSIPKRYTTWTSSRSRQASKAALALQQLILDPSPLVQTHSAKPRFLDFEKGMWTA